MHVVDQNGKHFNQVIGVLHGSTSNCGTGYDKSSLFTNLDNKQINYFIKDWNTKLENFGFEYVMQQVKNVTDVGWNFNTISKILV